MSSFRETRDALLVSYSQNILDETEFVLLYYCNTSNNPDFPYWNYHQYDLDKLSDFIEMMYIFWQIYFNFQIQSAATTELKLTK